MLVQRVGAAIVVVLGGFLVRSMASPGAVGATTDPGVLPVDPKVDPCVDFYRYACNLWTASNPIPPDRARYGRFDELAERNVALLHDILEDASTARKDRDALDTQIGDFYGACMDTAAISTIGPRPLLEILSGIDAIAGASDLAAELASLHGIGVDALFDFSSEQALREAPHMVAVVDQGGIGLPDRDDYTRDDPTSVAIRKAYTAHVERMFELLGEAPDRARGSAAAVMKVEAALAEASLSRVARRDPANLLHMMSKGDLEHLAPTFDWSGYFASSGAPAFARLNVTAPDFFRRVNSLLVDTPLADLKAYLRFRAASAAAPFLGPDFEGEHDAFFETLVRGRREAPPRWKRCVRFTSGSLGEALGQRFVARAFSPDAKARTIALVERIEGALRDDIQSLPWMTAATKLRALEKLDAVTNKIGYPDHFRDYSAVRVLRDDFFGNVLRAQRFETMRVLRRIGRDADKAEWDMPPQTVNAYYDAQQNSITFPAGILAPPFFAPSSTRPASEGAGVDRSLALDYGGIGAVIGHELSHGFDDAGRRFDPRGNFEDLWSPDDATAFTDRAQCFVGEYDAFPAMADLHVNGRLTLGENIADNGGVRLALAAFLRQRGAIVGEGGQGRFSDEQRFFLSYAGLWCQNETPEEARELVFTDPHSPAAARVNGVVSNLAEFAQAFGCSAGAPMVRANPCREF